MIELNDLLRDAGLDPASSVVMRHRPKEKSLRKVLPWLIQDRPELFTAFQSQHGPTVERILKNASTLASFVADGAGRALFVGIYAVRGFEQISQAQYWKKPENQILKMHGIRGPRPGQNPLWFDLESLPTLSELHGKLIVAWPGIERSWVRWANRNVIPVHAILEENKFNRELTPWDELLLSWTELQALPESLHRRMAEWRGIYYIRDSESGKGYVGSAYGAENISGRWKQYAASGHGGNRLLRGVNPENLTFSILQLVAPSMTFEEVVKLEGSWKLRLQTRAPLGLNEN